MKAVNYNGYHLRKVINFNFGLSMFSGKFFGKLQFERTVFDLKLEVPRAKFAQTLGICRLGRPTSSKPCFANRSLKHFANMAGFWASTSSSFFYKMLNIKHTFPCFISWREEFSSLIFWGKNYSRTCAPLACQHSFVGIRMAGFLGKPKEECITEDVFGRCTFQFERHHHLMIQSTSSHLLKYRL